MAIEWTVKKFLDEHEVSGYRFWQDTGLSSTVAYNIAKDKHPKVDGGVIAKVVPYLRELTGNPELQIGDILRYVDDVDDTKSG